MVDFKSAKSENFRKVEIGKEFNNVLSIEGSEDFVFMTSDKRKMVYLYSRKFRCVEVKVDGFGFENCFQKFFNILEFFLTDEFAFFRIDKAPDTYYCFKKVIGDDKVCFVDPFEIKIENFQKHNFSIAIDTHTIATLIGVN